MKTQKGIREHEADELRKAKRLEPMRKSGKERHSLYRSIDEEEEEELMPRRESILDYLDDQDEE
ncbi:hypothetical protein [Alistipes finegoldii]|jgi:hypothetical protein|uniref:hypothetical protein n=1 Tax=Alistipes finegoldii TaxID=214856 RepID=UPI00242D5E27|nr:hypothetical protein [Alistipes finegoldii]